MFPHAGGYDDPVSGSDGSLLIGKEHAVLDVIALGNPEQRTAAIHTAVAFCASMAAEGAWGPTFIKLSVWSHEFVEFHW